MIYRKPRKFVSLLILVVAMTAGAGHGIAHGAATILGDRSGDASLSVVDWKLGMAEQGLDPLDAMAAERMAEQFSDQISNVEWLAPLAPLALSPFFGITLLSGVACYGPEWLPNNALVHLHHAKYNCAVVLEVHL